MAKEKKRKTPSTQGGKNKRAGSQFEREIAKELSMWIYGSPSVLRRHPTSGTEKDYGQGADISLFQSGYDPFNFFVEVKRGYKTDILNARKQILEWYTNTKEKNKKKYPTWIIWKLLSRGILFITDKKLNKVEELYTIQNLYIYDFKEVLNIKFKQLKI